MATATTIQVKKDVVQLLQKAKEYPRQTYNELLERMTKMFLDARKKNQYDEFLHKIQQQKMKELWDNKEDEAWNEAR
ncbi:hypothetical protein HY489_00975 [Candidatus Woesearchaeota archaeon]|nr:hypothetical protein [Candidatus Woesearchaeota archaeon]